MTITIKTPKGERSIGPGHPVFIIAEMSGNHKQSFERALKLIDAAVEAGVDAIKLQTYTPNTLTINCDKEPFQVKINDAWAGSRLYDLYQKAYMPWEWQPELKKYAESKGVLLFSAAYEETSVEFLESINVQLHKVTSFETSHIPFLKRIGQTKKPVILSRGLTSLEELELAITVLKENGCPEIIILHCVSSYPATVEQMNLSTIPDIAKRFSVVTGLSDHSLGITAPIAAVALGASVIEKHYTLLRTEGGVDAAFSLEPKELKEMVQSIRNTEKALGTPSYEIKSKEGENFVFKQSIFVVKDIKKGDILNKENIRIIRPGQGLNPKYYEELLGKTASQDLERGTPLNKEMVEDFIPYDIKKENKEKEELIYRFADKNDCKTIFNWRNDPSTIRYAPSGKVDYNNHLNWFNQKISNPKTQIFMVTKRKDQNNSENEEIGMIRFDFRDDSCSEISINLNPQFRGQGWGAKMLASMTKKYFMNFNVKKIYAQIMAGNLGSIKLFEKCGFKLDQKEGKNEEETKILDYYLLR